MLTRTIQTAPCSSFLNLQFWYFFSSFSLLPSRPVCHISFLAIFLSLPSHSLIPSFLRSFAPFSSSFFFSPFFSFPFFSPSSSLFHDDKKDGRFRSSSMFRRNAIQRRIACCCTVSPALRFTRRSAEQSQINSHLGILHFLRFAVFQN